MGFNCGIIGLPNVGKSTLFNALTESKIADAQNYPFCTIEPNTGKVIVLDDLFLKLADTVKSKKIVPTQLEFVDIAGLVKGASKGEGLGNKFLSNISNVDAIIHVVRCFEDNDITHVNGIVNPLQDIDIIETELILSDLESLDKQIKNIEKKARGQDKESKELLNKAIFVKENLEKGIPVRLLNLEKDYFNLLTNKPVIYVCNVEEKSIICGNKYSDLVINKYKNISSVLIISAKIEMEISQIIDKKEKKMFLSEFGLIESGLDKIIKGGYEILNLQTFYTIGPKESHAWSITKGFTAPQAAGKIHSDFEKGFIRAEIISPEDFLYYGGELQVKEAGKMRLVGKDYIIQNGDICHFLFNL